MYYSRYLDARITAPESGNKIKLIVGPRQSGKATLLKHCLPSGCITINLQDRRERIKYERKPKAFLQELEAISVKTTVVIDEIQKVPALFDDIQYFFDKNREQFNFYLTGSSTRQLKTHSANLLPGRTHLYRLSPVLQVEQREAVILPLSLGEGRRFPVRPLDEVLLYGNLPGLYSEEKESWVDTYIGFRIPSFGRSRRKIVSAPRFLICDLGMRNSLSELPLNSSLIQLDAGHLFEQFVLIELFYRCQYLGKTYKLSTWRTSTGAEVDAVIETPEEVIPVEIKWTDSPQMKDVRHLERFLDLHPDLSRRGYLVCRVDKQRKLSERILAIPWDQF